MESMMSQEKNIYNNQNQESKQSILKQRARALAIQKDKKDQSVLSIETVEFVLSNELYAIELNYVREVYPLKGLTALPCTPPFVSGIINVRSQIVSIIDLKKFFELPDHDTDAKKRVIILHSNQMEFGILADEISGVRSIPADDIQMSMLTLQGIGSEYIKGVTEQRIVILDAEKILSDAKIVVHEEM
ncbi:MAG: Chemotaxis protein cheW [Candidatus Magnetoglobus multicellularis str. Araruama]|uniref:Chemotaxis protein cheW n=1 Tax=Candidatus Magnetoglobus multicellularis str. Araruama TaxID=890399 RepID=A0A1V1P1X6_9BACT|nr:MAG: Chemotaxis protein cheW [Candidatus Magnetoglobus multicellularis str. Araruama]